MVERRVRVFGALWCADSLRARRFLDHHRVPYDWIDVDDDESALSYVRQVNQGQLKTPTIVFPDDSILVEPGDVELARRLVRLGLFKSPDIAPP